MKLKVKRGLDIPIKGKPSAEIEELTKPRHIALNLEPFEDIRLKVLAKVGENVKIGQPLVENKAIPGQFFVSPAAGKIVELRRGFKRRLIDIIIQVDSQESHYENKPLSLASASKEQILACFMKGGIFPHIRMRPLNLIAKPSSLPRDIFVKAIETLPYVPAAEWQVKGYEREFQAGLTALSKITEGKVHLIYQTGSSCKAFNEATNVEKHQIVGPHPAGSFSYPIHKIAPIKHVQDIVWTLSVIDVITAGKMILTGHYHIDRILSVGGEGANENRRKLFKARVGYPLSHLLGNQLKEDAVRIISGDPLTGTTATLDDFMGFNHVTATVLIENTSREFLHFFRLGRNKFSATRTYVTGHKKSPPEGYHFTTSQHGEERAFIDSKVYDRVVPLPIPTMHLIKAILAEDFELAETLGLLEIVPEDFALPAFICPSKIEMIDIVKQGLKRYAHEVGID